MTNPNFKKSIGITVRFAMENLLNGAAQNHFQQDVVVGLVKRLLHPEERIRKGNILSFLLSGSRQEAQSKAWLQLVFQEAPF